MTIQCIAFIVFFTGTTMGFIEVYVSLVYYTSHPNNDDHEKVANSILVCESHLLGDHICCALR